MWGWIILGIFLALILFILLIRFYIICDYVNDALILKVKVLFFEKEIDVDKLIDSMIPSIRAKKEEKPQEEKKEEPKKAKKEGPPKESYIAKLYREKGILGILDLINNLLETVSSLFKTFIKHFIINNLDVRINVSVPFDAAATAQKYGEICGKYYPIIGIVRSNMKVKRYNEDIQADYLGNSTQTEVHFTASINVMNLLGAVFAAAKTFLVNLIKNK